MKSIDLIFDALRGGLLTERTRQRLKVVNDAARVQEKQLKELQKNIAQTAYGRRYGIEAGMDLSAWRTRVPICDYAGLEPYIEQVKAGAEDVLWPGSCGYFALSSGTTSGVSKYVPVTEAAGEHFRKANLDSLLYYTARSGGDSIFLGKHFFLGGVGISPCLPEGAVEPAFAGDLGDIIELSLPEWEEKSHYEPGHAIARMEDWSSKLVAMTQRSVDLDIRLINGMPSWLLVFAAAALEESWRLGRPAETLKNLWPNLKCIVHGGIPLSPFQDELRQICGNGVMFHEVYQTVEGFIAAQDAFADDGLRLICDAGIYYEFLPLTAYDEGRSIQPGENAVGVGEVKTGVAYVMIMTTPAGLCRYVPGDVVRFLSTEPPRLVYEGRTGMGMNVCGEGVVERELTEALARLCQRKGWQVVDFHVAPVFGASLIGQKTGCHEWWLELRVGSDATPTGVVIAEDLDQELCKINRRYETKRRDGVLGVPTVRLVMPGVFETWQRGTGRWGGQNKMPRCRRDRAIADELAKLARFHDSE